MVCECEGRDGNPLADVTWFKGNTKISSGQEEAILHLPSARKTDNGTYKCKAISGRDEATNETTIQVTVNCKESIELTRIRHTLLYSQSYALRIFTLRTKISRKLFVSSKQKHTK